MRVEGAHGGRHMQRMVEVCLLVLLCGPDGERSHGYALGERLRDFGFDDSEISVATLYRTLRGMEEAGWVTSEWAAGGPGPQRREYAVTDAGHAALDEWAAVLQKRRERITRVLDAYARLGREPVSADGIEDGMQHRNAGQGPRHSRRQAVQETVSSPAQAEAPVQQEPEKARRRETEKLQEYWD